ncbi:MAG TPA: ChaN family lipoprotein [Vicinamibacterales bacterium]|nr:ChaN family lipoprotein [Vicinamibacterales bacterium]
MVRFPTITTLALVLLQASGYVPERVYATGGRAFVDFEVMLADIAAADVVFVGEQHDDPNTHRLEAAILEGLQRRKVSPVVSLEMFERDVQGALDAYLAGRVGESETLKTARPWPRYATDYRPLVELARLHRWAVIAANVPRRLASAVAKGGKEAIDQLSEADRASAARELQCPLDDYFDRFAKSMASHPAPSQTAEDQRAMTERYYWSQCVKDETMAESIAAAVERRAAPGPVVHYNGAFHSDFGLGTAERTRRRLPGRRIVTISVLPVESLDTLNPAGEDLRRADYLVFTLK